MKYLIALSPGAKTDINSAVRWYLKIDLNLALRFFVEIDTTLQRIARMPYAFPVHRAAVSAKATEAVPLLDLLLCRKKCCECWSHFPWTPVWTGLDNPRAPSSL